MEPEYDPRIYFAAERTLLAWLRTGIAVLGLGFLVARFGVFLMMVRGQNVESPHVASSLIGISFVLLGASMIAAATWQHLKFSRSLPRHEFPRQYSMTFSLVISGLVATSAVLLAIYLAFSVMQLQTKSPATANDSHRTDPG